MSELTELPEPVGNFILNNIRGIQLEDGTYYHYSDVVRLLKKYKEYLNK